MLRWTLRLFVLICGAITLLGQQGTSSLVGTIVDPPGDPRGGNIGDAAQQGSGQRSPPQEKGCDQTRREVQYEIGGAGGKSTAEIVPQFFAGVFALQLGIVSHLPDPPIRGFDSDKVNTSKTAYPFGIPDGTLALSGFAGNILLAAWGDARRARKQPWIPIVAAGKALIEAGVAG